ncbi:unnamed protein product [Peniophora sp. CBMAI 1063]|nr:unnamed protein product [Peniophora sp. CBMAI 1063]
MLLAGTEQYISRLQLVQHFPSGAPRRRGALTLSDLCTPQRGLKFLDSRCPPAFDPASYHLVETLPDDTFHAVIHASHGGTSSRRHAPTASILPEHQRTLRPRKRVAEIQPNRSRTNRRRLRAEKRLIVFVQSAFERPPTFTDDGLRRVDAIMRADPTAEYFFVFVTGKYASLDLSAVPSALVKRVKWYQLTLDFNMYERHSISKPSPPTSPAPFLPYSPEW